jgi:serine/threonine protein kinase
MYVCPECGAGMGMSGYCPADGTQLAERKDELLGEMLGQFRVARMLGAGGMGTVYKAVHPDIGSRVAIKVLSHDCARRRDLVERFFAEARAVNVIRHESIVNVLDLAMLPDGRPYIVMEYLDGLSLSAVIEQQSPLPLGSLARLLGEVLGGLSAAHAKGIVHRDLKPDNIFVTPQGHAKVLDFGIAKLRPESGGGPTPTQTGSLLGTPQYMAPEQAMAQAVDARTDVYAMGIILYEGATGRKPFQAPSLFDLLRQQVEQAPMPPSAYRPDMPADYETVILRAMEKRPENRWQGAAALSNALAHVTMSLPGDAWAAIGVDARGAARIGPPSVPTPQGPALASTVRAATPTPSPPMLSPTPSASGEMAGARPYQPKKSRAALWIALALVAVAGIGVGIGVGVAGGGGGGGNEGEAATEGTGSGQPATGNRQPATGDAGVAVVAAGGGGVDGGGPPVVAAVAPVAVAAVAPAAVAAAAPVDAGAGGASIVIGGGRVQIKGNVLINGKPAAQVVVPAGSPGAAPSAPPVAPPTPPAVNAASFDVTGFVPKAQALARKYFDDAVLIRIDAEGVFPDGKARLTMVEDWDVTYRFASPSRSKRPKDLPKGVPFKPTCKVYVEVKSSGVGVWPLEGWECDEPLVGPPRCSARQVWQKARAQGATGEEAAASIGYWAGPGGKGRWHLDIEDEFSEWIDDGC